MKERKFIIRFSFVLAVALLTMVLQPTPLYAQITRGAVNGTVRDTSGAVVPGASVKVTNPATNVSRDTITNDEGFYRVAALDPGYLYGYYRKDWLRHGRKPRD